MLEVKYRRLNEVDREAISRGLAAGLSSAAIGRSICRPTSTVTREIARNYGRRLYRAGPAGRKAHKLMGHRRGGKRKLYADAELRCYVERRLARA
ncbi:MAG: helix-turn-helix domain-containing protein, partial [Acidiphilium sp.]